MREVKTNKGRIINMQELSDMYQETRAIGNMPVNARGDVVKGDVVIKPYSEVAKTRQVVAEKPQAEEVNIKENFGNPEEVITKVDEGHILNEYEGKDGKTYQEIEFADGSIQVREMKTTTESSKKTKTKK